jgi:branched-chain amino acid transport system substrate-binding protein
MSTIRSPETPFHPLQFFKSQIKAIFFTSLLVSVLIGNACESRATPQSKRIGLIASLSGFAAQYGKAVRQGTELGIEELRKAGHDVELFVEDDQSDPSKALSAYRYLKDIKGIQLLIGGSWWVRPLAPITERDSVPFLSCETMLDNDFIPSKTYFILNGRVADWVSIYDPFFASKNLQKGAVVKFTSGFSQTISDEMRRLFARPPRSFVGEFQYQDLQASSAGAIILKLKRSRPDVVYVDGQPEGLASFLRKRAEFGAQDMTVVGHSAFESAIRNRLVSPEHCRNLYFLRRVSADNDFVKRFQARFNQDPELSADLGYYAAYMALQALGSVDPVETLRRGMRVNGKDFFFDEKQVARGIAQEIFLVNENGQIVREGASP